MVKAAVTENNYLIVLATDTQVSLITLIKFSYKSELIKSTDNLQFCNEIFALTIFSATLLKCGRTAQN